MTFTIIDRRGRDGSFSEADADRKPDSQVRRLAKALAWSDTRMQSVRKARTAQIASYCGPDYGQTNTDKARPMPMIYGLVMALLPALTIEPKLEATSDDEDLDRQAPFFAERTNREILNLHLRDTVDDWILSGLFGPAYLLIDTMIAGPETENSDGLGLDCRVVALDDAIPDMLAKRFQDESYMAHRMSMDREWALEQAWANKTLIGKLSTSADDRRRESPAYELQRGSRDDDAHWRDDIQVVSVFLPAYRDKPARRVGLPADLSSAEGDYLWDIPVEDDGDSPYIGLRAVHVPDNSLPLSIVGVVSDLDAMLNKLARKFMRESENFKRLLLVRKKSQHDGDGVANASDLDIVPVDEPNDFLSVNMGGADPAIANALQYLEQMFNMRAGNPDALGGLQPGSKTLGQDQMLFSQASAKIALWRGRVLEGLGVALNKIARRAWDDTDTRMRFRLPDRDSGVMRPVHHWGVDPLYRSDGELAEFDDFKLSVSPYGFSGDSPEARYQRTVKWLESMSQLMAMATQQGYQIDIGRIMYDTGRQAGLDRAGQYVKRVGLPNPGASVGVTQIGGDTVNAGVRPQAALPRPMQQPQEPAPVVA